MTDPVVINFYTLDASDPKTLAGISAAAIEGMDSDG